MLLLFLWKAVEIAYIFLHHVRTRSTHYLHVILYEHSFNPLSTLQHSVDSNVCASSTNASTVPG